MEYTFFQEILINDIMNMRFISFDSFFNQITFPYGCFRSLPGLNLGLSTPGPRSLNKVTGLPEPSDPLS